MASAPYIELKRHFASLSPEETTRVVEVVAELIVTYMKKTGGNTRPTGQQSPHSTRDKNARKAR